MSEPFIPGDTVAWAIDELAIRERVRSNTVAVTAWAATRLVADNKATSDIAVLYSDYAQYCRRENCPPLARKTWLAAMKLAGFETQSGVFEGLKANRAE